MEAGIGRTPKSFPETMRRTSREPRKESAAKMDWKSTRGEPAPLNQLTIHPARTTSETTASAFSEPGIDRSPVGAALGGAVVAGGVTGYVMGHTSEWAAPSPIGDVT